MSASEAMEEVDYYHFDIKISVVTFLDGVETDEASTALVGDFQSPDRFKRTMTIASGDFSFQVDQIIIGRRAYDTNPFTGLWEESDSPVDVGTQDSLQTPALSDGEIVGEKVMDGVTVLHVRGVQDPETLGTKEGSLETEAWVGKDDLLIRRAEVYGELTMDDLAIVADVDTAGADGTGIYTVLAVYSAFHEPVSIQAPVIQ